MNDRKLIRPILDASYQPKKLADKTLAKSGYTLDKKLSTNESKVFIDSMGNPNIAFRGSTTAIDWLISDPLLAIGATRFDPRVKEAKSLTKQVEKKYGKPADVFGHSLGGSIAEISGAKGNITTYNKGVGIAGVGKAIPKNQTDIRTTADVVSALSLTQKYNGNQETIKGSLNPIKAHSLENLSAPFI
jgi:hypothetical protein